MNWYWIAGGGVACLVLLFYLARVNLKDKKEFEQQLNSDYKKTKDDEDEMEID